jgi:hypothetical protein
MAGSKSLLYLIYEDLVKAVKGIGVKTFLDRPKNGQSDLANFVVINIPTEIRGRVKGKISVMANSYGTFSVYCKAKTDSTLNVNAQGSLVDLVLDLFPINGEHITATEPRFLMQGEDGYGYQVTQITFKLRTKFNIKQ